MASRLCGWVLASVVALHTAVAGAAGIDEVYEKPAAAKSWGELLAQFLGVQGVGKSYALVVGVSEYRNGFPPLMATRSNPIRMRDFLLHEAGFDRVHVLTDEKATKARIEELMVDEFPRLVEPTDRFLFYWSGHGTQDEDAFGGKMGFLPLAGSARASFSSMISMDDIQRWDRRIRAEQALFLLDACFSGLAGSESMGGELTDLTVAQLSQPAHHLMTAGTEEESTIASDAWGGSIFTDSVLRGLRGEADAQTGFQRDGVVSLAELIAYVRQRVAFVRRQAGWSKAITPQLQHLRPNRGEFFFLTNAKKVAALEEAGQRPTGEFKHGLPITVMGALDAQGPVGPAVVAVIPEPTPEPSPAPTVIGPEVIEATLRLTGTQWRQVQLALATLGHDAGSPDGIVGPRTRAALRGWQRARGEEATGYLTVEQHQTLVAVAPEMEVAVGVFRDDGVIELSGAYPEPRSVFKDCAECPEMVVVPGGMFLMGSREGEEGRDDNEGPRHGVAIALFALGRYEVTFNQWDACVAAGGCSYKAGDEGWGRGRRPVIDVSWNDAREYVAWLSRETGETYRLPSEAEWEYAARAGTTTPYWWGYAIALDKTNCGAGIVNTTEVGSYPANPWGLHDTSGNVWEWTEDHWHYDYEGAPEDGSAWPGTSSAGVVRGGSWINASGYCRAASRLKIEPNFRSIYLGFRVVRMLTP